MYKRLFFFLLFISCWSCEGDKSNNISNTNLEINKDSSRNNPRDKFLQKYSGTWVCEEYYNSIVKSKSPYKAFQENPYFMLIIKTDQIKDDKIGIYEFSHDQTEISSIQYYEITNNQLIYKYDSFDGEILKEKSPNFIVKMDVYFDNQDTILRIQSSNGKKLNFKKLDSNCIDKTFDCEITQFLTSTILQGEYTLVDKSNNILSNKIQIDKYGQIQGSKLFKRAILWNSFREVNHPFEFDVLEFSPMNSSSKMNGFYNDNDNNIFKFEYENDTIKLNSLTFNEEENSVKTGDVKYCLIRR